MTAPRTGAPGAPAPAGTPAATPPTPSSGIAPESAVDRATKDALARIQSTGTALPPDPHHSQTQPRIESGEQGGQFAKSAVKEVGANAEGADGGTSSVAPPEGGQGAPEPKKEGEVLPGAEGAEGTPEGAQAEGEGDGVDDAIGDRVVKIPGRNAGEEIEIEVDDIETADALRRLTNGYQRGEESREILNQAHEQLRQVEEFEDMIAADPAGVVLNALGDDPQTLEHLAMYLVTRPEIWNKLGPQILGFADEEKLELAAEKVQNRRYALRDSYQQVARESRAVNDNLRAVQAAVGSIIPPTMAEDQQGIFYRDALRDIMEYAERNNRLTIDPRDVPLILAARMKANGIDPVEAARRLTDAMSSRGNRSSENRSGGSRPAANGAAETPKPPQRTGREMVEARERKAAAARVPGAGAGAQGAVLNPPPYDPSKPGSAIDQRIEWHRQQQQIATSKAH